MSKIPVSSNSPQEFWDNEVAAMPESAGDWIWPGFISRGNLTLLTSMWKAGKTTLLAHLLSRRASGQPFIGLPLAPGKTAVISEESRGLWADRCRAFQFGGNLCLFPQPFARLPTSDAWRGLLLRVGQLREQHGIDLLVVDSLTHFLRAENSGSGILELVMPVRELTACGMAAVLIHHPRKCRPEAGLAGRGHGALHAEADISIEMRHAGGNLDSRARRFLCLSRHAATPRHFLFELNAAGSDYTPLEIKEGADFAEHWNVLRMVLEDAPQKLTRQDILDEWPADFPKPAIQTLWTWLDRGVKDKLIQVEGSGRKNDPLRYWLAVAEERWKQDPFYELQEAQRRELNLPFESLRERTKREAANAAADRVVEKPLKRGERLWPPGAPVE